MPWVRIEDDMPNHPKMFRAGVCALGWWTAALCYCNRYLTDGFIPQRDIFLIAPGTPDQSVLDLVEILVRERLLETREDGYQMHDYLHYQASKKNVNAAKRQRLTAARKGGESTREKHRAARLAEIGPTPASSQAKPSQAKPSQENLSTAAPTFQVPESILGALKRAPRLGAVGLLQEPRFWQAELRANPGVDFAAEVLKAEAWIAANPRKAPQKDLPRFLHNWLARADR